MVGIVVARVGCSRGGAIQEWGVGERRRRGVGVRHSNLKRPTGTGPGPGPSDRTPPGTFKFVTSEVPPAGPRHRAAGARPAAGRDSDPATVTTVLSRRRGGHGYPGPGR
eukprot:753261-Hanusia_phi.AAC.4